MVSALLVQEWTHTHPVPADLNHEQSQDNFSVRQDLYFVACNSFHWDSNPSHKHRERQRHYKKNLGCVCVCLCVHVRMLPDRSTNHPVLIRTTPDLMGKQHLSLNEKILCKVEACCWLASTTSQDAEDSRVMM